MTDTLIEYVVEDGLGVLRINRPEARNALNWAAQEAFAAAVEAAAHDPGLRVLIVTGAGDRAFASGGDLKELAGHPEPAAGERLNRVMSQALAGLTKLPVPVIAAVNGDAIGGGCEMMTACDLRLAAAHARFRFAQVQVGLTTGWGGTGRLVCLLGQSRAIELLLTGRAIDTQEAQAIGFIHRVAPAGEAVLTAAREWAIQLIALPRQALAATKTLVQAAGRLSLPEVYELEAGLFTGLWNDPDHLEAMAAFVEKREAVFGRV
ncbi:MAG: enoyl-CoA hydratase/isomerase family protein [Chloroflexi bacterium]|nr:enoyl-CoA hydratase/isomerase family protein [Chloroflexota bacterium]